MSQQFKPKQEAPTQKEQEQARVEDHITKRFELGDFKGKGAYGIVWKAVDKKTQQTVALKKIFDAFHNATDAQRTFREVIFLEQLTEHENIVKLLSVIRADNDRDLYMVFEYMETDLHKVIRAGILESIHKKYVVYQCLKALKYIHSADLIHRDLKPSNLLINSQCKIKVADFGLARSLLVHDYESNPILTEYVATRWYRAPEILLGSQEYSKAIDIWSIGCIVGEMIVGKAIFAGTSTLNQIEKIIELIGRPKPDDLEQMQAPLAQNLLQNITTQKKKSFVQFFSGGSDDAIDFIRRCLVYNSSKRMTVEQGLHHPYLSEFFGTEAETVKDKSVQPILNDNQKFSVKEYRQELYNHLASQKRQIHKQLIIKANKISERQQSTSVSPQKTEQKQNENHPIKDEQCENVQTVKRIVESASETGIGKPRKVQHNKSQTYVPSQYNSNVNKDQQIAQILNAQFQSRLQQSVSIIQDVESVNHNSPSNKIKQSVIKSILSRTNAIQSFLPQMDPNVNKPFSRNASFDKKLRSSGGFLQTQQNPQNTQQLSTQQQFTQPQSIQSMDTNQSNYFFNGTPAPARKNSVVKQISKVPQKSLLATHLGNQAHSMQKLGGKGYGDKTVGEQQKQYMSMKSFMGQNTYDNIFQAKVKTRK